MKNKKKITVAKARRQEASVRLAKIKKLRQESAQERRERVAQSKKLRPAVIPDKKNKLREKAIISEE